MPRGPAGRQRQKRKSARKIVPVSFGESLREVAGRSEWGLGSWPYNGASRASQKEYRGYSLIKIVSTMAFPVQDMVPAMTGRVSSRLGIFDIGQRPR